jgi:hypothetical protein
MVATGWVNNLDFLAQNGVLEYDAASDVMGMPPRYMGNPAIIPNFAPPQINKNQPKKDEFVPQENFAVPKWKKNLFKLLVAGVAAFGGYKIFKFFKRP